MCLSITHRFRVTAQDRTVHIYSILYIRKCIQSAKLLYNSAKRTEIEVRYRHVPAAPT